MGKNLNKNPLQDTKENSVKNVVKKGKKITKISGWSKQKTAKRPNSFYFFLTNFLISRKYSQALYNPKIAQGITTIQENQNFSKINGKATA